MVTISVSVWASGRLLRVLVLCGRRSTWPTTGVVDMTLSEMRYELEPVSRATKGQRISIPVPRKVRANDRLYLFRERTEVQHFKG